MRRNPFFNAVDLIKNKVDFEHTVEKLSDKESRNYYKLDLAKDETELAIVHSCYQPDGKAHLSFYENYQKMKCAAAVFITLPGMEKIKMTLAKKLFFGHTLISLETTSIAKSKIATVSKYFQE